MIERNVLAVVPADVNVAHKATVYLADGTKLENQAVVYMKDPRQNPEDEANKLQKPSLRISKHKSYGVLFTFVLLLVIFITNVPLRGMWSLVVIIVVAFFILLFAYFQVWDWLFGI